MARRDKWGKNLVSSDIIDLWSNQYESHYAVYPDDKIQTAELKDLNTDSIRTDAVSIGSYNSV
jgi:hypothetical protein